MNDFEQARKEFVGQLSAEEQAKFNPIKSADDFLDGLKKFEKFAENKKWAKVFKSVQRCSNKLGPYFEILGIVVQSHPEWAAIAWGAFRLILQLSCNFVSFFEKLGDLLWQLSEEIPTYNGLAESLKGNAGINTSERFQASLRAFYVDLFELFGAISGVFTQKSGKLKRTPVVIAQLLWQPFNVRFANILQRLKKHREILNLEMSAKHFQTTTHIATNQSSLLQERNKFAREMKEEISEWRKRALLKDMNAWLESPSFKEPFERASKLRQDGTAEWIFATKSYNEWIRKQSHGNSTQPMERFLWVRGNPGTGKSVLAAAVLQELLTSDVGECDTTSLVSYYFFEYNAKDESPAPQDYAYRAILSQVLDRFEADEDILEVISFAMMSGKKGQPRATPTELLELLRTLATRIDSWHIIIDAVDECTNPEEVCLELSRALGDRPTNIALFSRPNVRSLHRKMKAEQILTINRSSNDADLRLYFDTHMERLQELGTIPEHACREELVKSLLTGADGMFQWAKLMIVHLESDALVSWQKLEVIENLKTPENLDDMYIRILDSLAKKLVPEQSLARFLFLWLILKKRNLVESQIQDILTPVKQDVDQPKTICRRDKADEFINFEHTIIMLSGSLVERRQCGNSRAIIYCFIHGSVLEFFLSKLKDSTATFGNKAGSRAYFLPPVCQAELELTVACLTYMFQRVPEKPLSGDMFEAESRENLSGTVPFLQYAGLCWTRHLVSMRIPLKDLREPDLSKFYHIVEALYATLHRFLLSKLMPMVWVEVMYTFRHKSSKQNDIYRCLSDWAAWAQDLDKSRLTEESKEVSIAIAAFSKDLEKLHGLWGDTLVDGPHQIWNDTTAFTNSPFFVQTSAVTIKSLTTESSNRSALSTTPLSKISRDDATLERLGVLTVWPSSAFEISWRKLTGRRKYKMKEDDFDGWVAQYELWDIGHDDPFIVETSTIPLDKMEVRIQYERFQKYTWGPGKSSKSGKELALHFPTSIADGLETITVLRTVFQRSQRTKSNRASSDSHGLWRPVLMPIVHTADSTFLQGPSKTKRPSMTHDTHEAPVASAYDTLLRFDRTPAFRMISFQNYVLYQSVEGREALMQDEDGAATVAVYRLLNANGSDHIALLGCIDGDRDQGSIAHCVFHPKCPLLAFHYRSDQGLDISEIILWGFAIDVASDDEFVLLTHKILQVKKGAFFLSVASIKGRLKSLQFSACGIQIIYQLYSSPYPHIVDIHRTHVYDIAMQQQAKLEELFMIPTPSPTEQGSTSHALIKPNCLPQSLSLNQAVMHENDALTSLLFNPMAANRSVKVVHYRDGAEEEQPLLSLPAWSDVNNISVSVHMPSRTREDKVTIILNKTPQPFYMLGNKGDNTSPAVVRKDIRAIAKPKVKFASGSGAKESRWSGITYFENRDEDEEARVNKKPRTIDGK